MVEYASCIFLPKSRHNQADLQRLSKAELVALLGAERADKTRLEQGYTARLRDQEAYIRNQENPIRFLEEIVRLREIQKFA